MKKILILILALTIVSCGANLKASYKLSPNMTKEEVEKIMGQPTKSDFKDNVEEWHYCRTGLGSDEFLALFFHNGKLIEKLNYTVTMADTRGVAGACSKFIKRGNYREPDSVIEIRMR
jgi:hypothetical protein